MPYRFAIVGCGNISTRHAEAIRKVGTLVGVCDPHLSRAEKLADLYGSHAFPDPAEMLLDTKPDIVAVCTPSGMHPAHVLNALDAGCHVVCEKPLAITSQGARELLKKADFNGRKIFVVKQNRFNPPVLAVKKLLDAGKLGSVHAFQINCLWNRNDDYYITAPWRGTNSMAGGTLFTQFSHFIDLLYWLLGNIREVKGWRGNFCHQTLLEFEDTGTAAIRMEGGAIGSLHYTINAHRCNLEGSIALFGDRGSVKIGGPYLNNFEYFDVQGETVDDWVGLYRHAVKSGHDAVYETVVKALEDPVNTAVEGTDALRSIEMIEQIYNASPMLP